MLQKEGGFVLVSFDQLPGLKLTAKTRQGHYASVSSEGCGTSSFVVKVPEQEGELPDYWYVLEAYRMLQEELSQLLEDHLVKEHQRLETGHMWLNQSLGL